MFKHSGSDNTDDPRKNLESVFRASRYDAESSPAPSIVEPIAGPTEEVDQKTGKWKQLGYWATEVVNAIKSLVGAEKGFGDWRLSCMSLLVEVESLKVLRRVIDIMPEPEKCKCQDPLKCKRNLKIVLEDAQAEYNLSGLDLLNYIDVKDTLDLAGLLKSVRCCQ